MKRIVAPVLAAAALLLSPAAFAAGGAGKLAGHEFTFDGPFGAFDQGELQRGLKVYREVCAACHSLKYVSFRTLMDENGPGLGEAEVKTIAAEYDVADPEGEPGDTISAIPADYFPELYGVVGNPPDLSLMAKARAGGADYIYSLLTGYTGSEKEVGGVTLYENTAYGGYYSMPKPMEDGFVTYDDGTPETLEQYSNDVAAFLMWAAEPHMVERKQAGVKYLTFLVLFAALVWFTNRKVWAKVKHPEEHG